MSSVSVWKPGEAPLSKRKWKGTGRPTKLLRRDNHHPPLAVKDLAHSLPASAWRTVTWRQGTKQSLRSRFAAVRVRPAHRDYWQSEPRPEEWLLMEWPRGEAEPTKYWFSTLPADTTLSNLVRLAIAAYGFLVAERSRFSPSARAGKLQLCTPQLPLHFKPRGSPRPGRAA